MIEKKDLSKGDAFEEAASHLLVYQIKTSWLYIQKLGDKMAKKYDATLSMAFVLMAIFEEGGTPVTKIAPRIGLEPNSLSRVLKSMEKKDFIYRDADEMDKRVVLIKLTELGKTRREIALRSVFKIEKDLTSKLSSKDLEAFFKVIGIVNGELRK